VFWSKLDKRWDITQKEFSLAALPWVVNRFENGFFKPEGQGGVFRFRAKLA
jgi:hypothetical protein